MTTPPTPGPGAPPPRPGRPPPEPELPSWRPTSLRLRGLLVLLAVGTALLIGWHMLQPKLKLMAARAARGEAPVPIGLPTPAHRAATPGASGAAPAPGAGEPPACGTRPVPGCIGGKMDVLVLPPAASR